MANDNLSGAISALALARYFQNNRPLNTELWFVAFGCEEAGQRGSTNFALQHKQEMIDKDAYFVNLESIGGGTFLLFATEETMCIPHIKHNPDVYNLLKDASRYVFTRRQSLRSPLTQGYTDAEAFSRIGIKASTILGLMLDGFPMLWHIKTDIPDNIRPGCMRDAMEICIKAVQIRDEQVSRSSLSRELA
jgi:Zn-dependent M28 family amino/carboxypeptidase